MEIKNAELEFSSLAERAETNRFILHHIGGSNRDVEPSEVHAWHKSNGWAGCGYHFLISKDGTVWECRPRGTKGSHAYGANFDSVGINVVGDFVNYSPEEVQIESLAALLAQLCNEYDLEPNAETIIGHRDTGDTECPGDNLYSLLPSIIEKTKGLMV